MSAATDVAVIGMAGRFPGARSVDAFWEMLREGREPLTVFSREALLAAGVPASVVDDPDYVPCEHVMEDIDRFDAVFFGYSPREAAIIDPQNRLFMTCAWEALEAAGYDTEQYGGVIGVYGGSTTSTYLMYNLAPHGDRLGLRELHPGIHKDFLTTGTAYKLNLRGPSVSVQSFCSTSLLAVHLAVQAVLNGECDLALAGGSSIKVPSGVGYHRAHREGILSPDGRCRAFDAAARGTPFSNGVGVVVLKRADQALADGDNVIALIRGSAANNDGAVKVSFMGPSADGQAEVAAEALACAGVEPESITFVEAHGTGTALGDPVEVRGLTRAYGGGPRGRCALGSVKTNVGHLDTASGVAGLIKTVLALHHREIPPTLHFERPNPEIDFAAGPFYVNTTLLPWDTGGAPRRAGLSSIGAGGTNVHLVLEEAPAPQPTAEGGACQLLVLSARTPRALNAATANLRDALRTRPQAALADVAFTLQTGRRAFNHRRAVVCRDADEAVAALDAALRAPGGRDARQQEQRDRPVSLRFTGTSVLPPRAAATLHRTERVFREALDACATAARSHLGRDVRALLLEGGPAGSGDEAAADSRRAAVACGFALEYAAARQLIAWTAPPAGATGQGTGAHVAAAVLGTRSLPDAMALALADASHASIAGSASAATDAVSPGAIVLAFGGGDAPAGIADGDWIPVFPSSDTASPDETVLASALGALWLAGASVAWSAVHPSRRRRVPLPTYPFETQRFWIDPPAPDAVPTAARERGDAGAPVRWRLAPPFPSPEAAPPASRHWWIFADTAGVAREQARRLREVGDSVVLVDGTGTVPSAAGAPDEVLVCWCLDLASAHEAGLSDATAAAERTWDAFAALAAALAADPRLATGDITVRVLTRGARPVGHRPTLLGLAQAHAWDAGGPAGRLPGPIAWVDLDPASGGGEVEALFAELRRARPDAQVAFRGGARYAAEDGESGVGGDDTLVGAAGMERHPRPALDTPYRAPESATERSVTALWQEMLGVDGIGADDDFYGLGGDSLLATRVATRLRDRFGVELPLADVFTATTPAALAARIDEATPAGAGPGPDPAEREEIIL